LSPFRSMLLVTSIAATLSATALVAKRMPPKPVTPVVSEGVRYSADGDGRDEYVVAENVSTGNLLWKVKVFHTRIKFWIEEDTQIVFITNLKLLGSSLMVRNEQGRCYAVNLQKKRVTKRDCGNIF
jgi:hypothetical protein